MLSLPAKSVFFVFPIVWFFYFLWRSKFTDSYSSCGNGEYWDWNFLPVKRGCGSDVCGLRIWRLVFLNALIALYELFFVFPIFCFFYFLWRSNFTDSYSSCVNGEYWDWNFWRVKRAVGLKFGFPECPHCPLRVIFLFSPYFGFSTFYDVPNSQIHIQVAVMASTGIEISGEWKLLRG